MTITWKNFVQAWREGTATQDPSMLDAMLADDFTWPTSNMDRDATLDWTRNTDFRATDYEETLYENDDVIAGFHGVNGDGHYNVVMGVAYLRDGKIYLYKHLRKPENAL